MNETKINVLKRAFIVSSIIPAYVIIFLGLFVGAFISVVRFNQWDLLFPFFVKFLPPVIVIYFFLLSLYFIYSWSKLLSLQGAIENIGDLSSVRQLVEFPRFLSITSFIFWIFAAVSTFFVLYFFEFVDNLTSISLSVLTLGLGPVVALTIRANMERSLAYLFSDSELNIKEELDSLVKGGLKRKVLYQVFAVMSATTSVLAVFSAEFISRTVKDDESKNLVESYFRGEKILNQISWKLDNGVKVDFIDDYVRKAIIKKVQRGENILYDYLSSSVFIFSKKGNSIEGIFVPIQQAESKALSTIFLLLFLSLILNSVIIAMYNASFGRYLMEAFLSIGKKLWLGGDEFTLLSAKLILTNRKYKEMELQHGKMKEECGYMLSQVFSEFIAIRSKINSVLGHIRAVKISIGRIIQMSGKEVEEIDIHLGDFASIQLEQMETISKKLRDISSLIGGVRTEIQNLIRYVSSDSRSPYIPTEKLIDSGFSVAEASIIKRMEMISNTMSELDSSISKTSEVLRSIQEGISKFRELLKMIDGILLDADRLKKKLFVLSMNISIVSGKVTQEEIMEEFSAVAKQMSSLLSDDLRKVEVGLKNLGVQIRNYVGSLSSSETVDIGESYVISAKGIAGKIDDIFDSMQNEIRYIIEQSSDMRKNLKDMIEVVRNLTSTIGKVQSSLSNVDNLTSTSQEDIEKISSVVSGLAEQINSVFSSVRKFCRDAENTITKYKNTLSEFGLLMKNVRSEIVKIQESYDKVESVLSKITSDIEKVTEKLQESMNKISSFEF